MKLYIDIKKLNFNEENNAIEHDIILKVSNTEFIGYDLIIELSNKDQFIKDTMKIEDERTSFIVREQKTWWSFPLYEIVNGEIISFKYENYSYFSGTDRRMALAKKINKLYNPYAELKLHRKTLRYIMDTLNIDYPDFFRKYNDKVEAIINKNPKN